MEDPETLQRMLIQARSLGKAGPGEPEPPFTKRKFRVTGGKKPQDLGFRSAFEWLSLVFDGRVGVRLRRVILELFGPRNNCLTVLNQCLKKHSFFVVQPIGREQHSPMTRCRFFVFSQRESRDRLCAVKVKRPANSTTTFCWVCKGSYHLQVKLSNQILPF